jgi:hypothetical protein
MIPSYKDIVELIKKGATVEAQEKIMELREGALELQEENVVLKANIKELEDKLGIQGNLEFENGIYWLWEEDAAGDFTIKAGPFCQHCYDDETKLIRLQKIAIDDYDPGTGTASRSGEFYYSCYKCKNNYQTGS